MPTALTYLSIILRKVDTATHGPKSGIGNTGLSRSGLLDARNRRKQGRWHGVPIHRKGRGGYKRMKEFGKAYSPVEPREVYFFGCYVQGSSLKNTVFSRK